MTWIGGCLCGAVRYEADVAPLWISHCHCAMCRKHTGAALGTYVAFRAGTLRWIGDEPRRYRSSKDVERSFCPTCGSTIGFHRVHETSLSLGSFDRPDDLAAVEGLRVHVWYQEHVSWFDTADSWPRHERFPPGRDDEIESLSGQAIEG